jgi:hypothetical protein
MHLIYIKLSALAALERTNALNRWHSEFPASAQTSYTSAVVSIPAAGTSTPIQPSSDITQKIHQDLELGSSAGAILRHGNTEGRVTI